MSERRRSLAADLMAPMPVRRSPLDAADPVTRVWENLPSLPRRYGAEVTTPGRDVSMGERPLMPRFDGAPLVTPAENANTMAHANAISGMTGSIRAFHGSPHRFDRFSMDRIGTGEGAQAYGHGLYFAENEGVARSYRDSLSQLPTVRIGGRDIHNANVSRDARNAAGDLSIVNGDFAAARARANLISPSFRESYIRGLDELEKLGAETQSRGHMYEVRLNTDPSRLLDWDAPLSRQPQAVRQAMDQIGFQARGGWQEAGTNTFERTGARGSDATVRMIDRGNGPEWLATYDTLYNRGSQRFPTQEAAQRWIDTEAPIEAGRGAEIYQELRRSAPDARITENLRNAGIDGIQYLDQGSRAAGEGSRNYVMFDDRLIEILRKYGLAGLLLPGAAAGTAEAAPQ